MDEKSDAALAPEIVFANEARFVREQIIHYHSVESRMCLWCKLGAGTVAINGCRFVVRPYDYFVLPWRHDVRYEPAPEAPFIMAGIHLIPWHDPAVDLEWGVAHDRACPLYGVPWRQDRESAGSGEIIHRHLHHDHALLQLSDYIVQHGRSPGRDRTHLKYCAHALLDEIGYAIREEVALPRQLQQLQQFIQLNVARPIGVRDLAAVIDRSPSQVARLCRRHLERTPEQWITGIKIGLACEWLRATRLGMAEIAGRAGYDDPFYFSRVFKKHIGISPLKYRQQQPVL